MNCIFCGEKLHNHSEVNVIQAFVIEIIVTCEICEQEHTFYIDLNKEKIEFDFNPKTFTWNE